MMDIEVNPSTGATRFEFDLGGVLEVRRMERSDTDIWSLFKPSGYVLSVKGDLTYAHCPGTYTDEQVRARSRPLADL